MFQTYEPAADRTYAAKHIPLLRAEMARQSLDGFIVPHADEYQNEYTPAHAKRLTWVSGFSGSAGAAIILTDQAVIFVDGRYTLQVRDQVDDAVFAYEDLMETPPAKWLTANAAKGAVIGYDPMLHSKGGVKDLEKAAAKAGFALKAVTENPVDAAWTDQPAPPLEKAIVHEAAFAGRCSTDKRAEVAKAVADAGADAALLTAPHSLAWLLNIRGGDVAHTPLVLGRAVIEADGGATLFVHPDKMTNAVADHLGSDVHIRPETDIETALRDMGQNGKRVLADPALTPYWFFKTLEEAGATVIEVRDPCVLPRALKNETELNGARAAHIRDGVAVTRFLHWLDEKALSGGVDEIAAAKQLEAFRAETGALEDVSFESISGAGANGAIVHYRVSTETNRKLEPGSLYLIDSGGQYKDGTTDITRTVVIGAPTDEMRDRYTLVLKGHIGIATARFPTGSSGAQLDVLARMPLWQAGLDFDHGTGHGVGSFLGVHEGPQGIHKRSQEALLPGMILSNEPGYYKTGEYGIRIENLVVVTPLQPVSGGEREMMGFETITLAPYDRRLINVSMLSAEELDWVNAYHGRVFGALQEKVPADTRSWLKSATSKL